MPSKIEVAPRYMLLTPLTLWQGFTLLTWFYTVDMVYTGEKVYTVDSVYSIQTALHRLNSSIYAYIYIAVELSGHF